MVNINTLSQIALLILKKADPFKGRPTETGHRGYPAWDWLKAKGKPRNSQMWKRVSKCTDAGQKKKTLQEPIVG